MGGVGVLLILCNSEADQEAWTVALAVERNVRHPQYSVKMPCYLRQWGYPLSLLASLVEGGMLFSTVMAEHLAEAKAAVNLLAKYCVKNGLPMFTVGLVDSCRLQSRN